MSHAASLGPPRSHPHPPAPSPPVLQTTGAAPSRGGLRLLAAHLLAEQVERMSRADARLERLLAAGLRKTTVRGIVRARQAKSAGAPVTAAGPRATAGRAAWPRAEEMARMLGLESATVRELVRFDRVLAALPRIAAAYDGGELSRAKLIALLPLATHETEEIWLARAARYDARGLGAIGPDSGGTAASGTPPAPDVMPADGRRPGHGPHPPRTAGDEFPVWMNATAAVREALRPLGPDTDPDALAAGRIGDPPAGPATSATLFDAGDAAGPAVREVASLRHLVALRQSVEWRMGRLLAALRRHALHLELGSSSLEEWAAVVPGLPPQRVGELLAMDRGLATLPATAEAWRRGRITWMQARLLVQAADPRTERHWLRLAGQVAPERLTALVAAAQATARAVGPGAARALELAGVSGRRRGRAE